MRLLVLTHAFPPSTHANAKRPHYLVKGFLDAGWEVDVITSTLGMSGGDAQTLSHPRLRITRFGEPADALRRKLSSWPRLMRCAGLAMAGLLWPDERVLWSRRALSAVQSAGEYDRTLVFVRPASLFLAARRGLVQSTWAFDFQEPISPQFVSQRRRSPLHKLLLSSLRKLETAALHQAGLAVFTADSNRQRYIEDGLVPARRTLHLPYFYDAGAFKAPGRVPRDRFEIVYMGTFDWRGARSPETFLRSLARFLERHPEAREVTRFVFHGHWLTEHNRLIEELRLQPAVQICGVLCPEAYLAKLQESPVLLLVVAAAHNLFMPSKIVDYFGSGRPILAFVPRESEMKRVLDSAGMGQFACDPAGAEEGVAALDRLWTQFRAGSLEVDSGRSAYWSSETQIPLYLQAISRLG